jgi:hypothetical protein
MNLDELQRKLVAAARADTPSERVPYAFEKRILARLQASLAPDPWAIWSRALWRAAVPCVAIMLLLSAWSYFAPPTNSNGTDLSQEFESTVLAATDPEPTTDSIW